MKEIRTFPIAELRVKKEDKPQVCGYAALYNTLSEEIWGMREQIAPGAFKNALAKSDIRALFNHDANYVLGRTSSKTLSVYDDDRGLYFEDDPPETTWANDLIVSMDRGDINQCSFGFIVARDRWEDTPDGYVLRTILEIEELFDVSVVTYPAYTQTSAQLRSLGVDIEQNKQLIADKIAEIRKKPDDNPITDPPAGDGGNTTVNRLILCRKRLDIAERSII